MLLLAPRQKINICIGTSWKSRPHGIPIFFQYVFYFSTILHRLPTAMAPRFLSGGFPLFLLTKTINFIFNFCRGYALLWQPASQVDGSPLLCLTNPYLYFIFLQRLYTAMATRFSSSRFSSALSHKFVPLFYIFAEAIYRYGNPLL